MCRYEKKSENGGGGRPHFLPVITRLVHPRPTTTHLSLPSETRRIPSTVLQTHPAVYRLIECLKLYSGESNVAVVAVVLARSGESGHNNVYWHCVSCLYIFLLSNGRIYMRVSNARHHVVHVCTKKIRKKPKNHQRRPH
jgi:hypothetical protein